MRKEWGIILTKREKKRKTKHSNNIEVKHIRNFMRIPLLQTKQREELGISDLKRVPGPTKPSIPELSLPQAAPHLLLNLLSRGCRHLRFRHNAKLRHR
jgi:hypothetical protein